MNRIPEDATLKPEFETGGTRAFGSFVTPAVHDSLNDCVVHDLMEVFQDGCRADEGLVPEPLRELSNQDPLRELAQGNLNQMATCSNTPFQYFSAGWSNPDAAMLDLDWKGTGISDLEFDMLRNSVQTDQDFGNQQPSTTLPIDPNPNLSGRSWSIASPTTIRWESKPVNLSTASFVQGDIRKRSAEDNSYQYYKRLASGETYPHYIPRNPISADRPLGDYGDSSVVGTSQDKSPKKTVIGSSSEAVLHSEVFNKPMVGATVHGPKRSLINHQTLMGARYLQSAHSIDNQQSIKNIAGMAMIPKTTIEPKVPKASSIASILEATADMLTTNALPAWCRPNKKVQVQSKPTQYRGSEQGWITPSEEATLRDSLIVKASPRYGDKGLPRTEAEYDELAKRLFDAIINNSHFFGPTRNIASRLVAGQVKRPYIMLCARQVVLLAIRYHQSGLIVPQYADTSVTGLDKTIGSREHNDTFEDRFRNMCDAARLSKLICKDLLDYERSPIDFVMHPMKTLKEKFSYESSNRERAANTQALKQAANAAHIPEHKEANANEGAQY